jgi:hypothetical protein
MSNSDPNPSTAPDALSQLQILVNAAEATAASKVEAWQKVHVSLHNAQSLLQAFRLDQQATEGSESAFLIQSQFSQIAATTFVPMAIQLQNQQEPLSTKAAANILLSSIQTSLSSNLANLTNKDSFQSTKTILESASYPIQGAIERLRTLLSDFSPHFSTMLDSIEADLHNSTNPLSLSNAAKNARELFTFLAREFQSDDALRGWPDIGFDDRGNPTRRSRLEFYIYLGLPKSALPEMWVNTSEIQVSALLKGFDVLNKLTHINPQTATSLVAARLPIGEFLEHLVVCLQARDGTKGLLVDALMEPVSERLQQLAEGELQGHLEEGVSHAYGPSIWVDHLEPSEIESLNVHFVGSGTIECTFQIGSDGDVSRGDGIEWEGSRGLSFKGVSLISPTNRLKAIEEVVIEPEDCELDDAFDDENEDDDEWGNQDRQ